MCGRRGSRSRRARRGSGGAAPGLDGAGGAACDSWGSRSALGESPGLAAEDRAARPRRRRGRPRGDDPYAWVLNVVDVLGTLAIVGVLFVLVRRGRLQAVRVAPSPPTRTASPRRSSGESGAEPPRVLELRRPGDAFAVATVCGKCGKPWLVRYDLARARATLTRDRLASRRADLWRYREVLPVASDSEIVGLGEG